MRFSDEVTRRATITGKGWRDVEICAGQAPPRIEICELGPCFGRSAGVAFGEPASIDQIVAFVREELSIPASKRKPAASSAIVVRDRLRQHKIHLSFFLRPKQRPRMLLRFIGPRSGVRGELVLEGEGALEDFADSLARVRDEVFLAVGASALPRLVEV